MSDWAPIAASAPATRTVNPIRAIVDHIKPRADHPKKMLALSIGDPTLDGNLLPPAHYEDALCEAVKGQKKNGYPPSVGYEDSRAAVAKYYTDEFLAGRAAADTTPTAADVVLASGASHALEMAIGALCNEGDSILLPKPCFSLYGVITSNRGIEARYYDCVPEKSWEVDVASVRAMVTPTTKAILINNPSNPCGSNFSKAHVEAIVALAEELKLPIISDEIYAGLVFHDADGKPTTFTSVAAVARKAPCFIVGGIAKTFLVPGHRLGWILKFDPAGLAGDVFKGIVALSTLIVGPNSIIQAALPKLLLETPRAYYDALYKTLEDHAQLCYSLVAAADGLTPIRPQGAMYMMIRIDLARFPAASGIKDDVAFASKLMEDQNVQVLPGSIFGADGFIRLVFTKPADQLEEAVRRLVDFVAKSTAAQ